MSAIVDSHPPLPFTLIMICGICICQHAHTQVYIPGFSPKMCLCTVRRGYTSIKQITQGVLNYEKENKQYLKESEDLPPMDSSRKREKQERKGEMD